MPPLSLIPILSTLSIKRFVSYNSSCKRRTRSANCSWLSKASYVYLRPCYDLRTTTEWPRYDTPWTRLQRASLSDLYMFRSSSCIFMFHFMLKLNSFFILMLKNLCFFYSYFFTCYHFTISLTWTDSITSAGSVALYWTATYCLGHVQRERLLYDLTLPW